MDDSIAQKTDFLAIYSLHGSGTQILHSYKYKRSSFNFRHCSEVPTVLSSGCYCKQFKYYNKKPVFLANVQCFSSSFLHICYMNKLLSMHIKVVGSYPPWNMHFTCEPSHSLNINTSLFDKFRHGFPPFLKNTCTLSPQGGHNSTNLIFYILTCTIISHVKNTYNFLSHYNYLLINIIKEEWTFYQEFPPVY